jgi:[ribosomal protein S5]-alanine N-acetyltransferase
LSSSDHVFPILTTARLVLRAVQPDDATPFHALMSIADTTRYSNWPDLQSLEDIVKTIERMSGTFAAGTGCSWIIEDRRTADFVGSIRLNWIDKEWKRGGIGYELHPTYWRQGLAAEALRAVVTCSHGTFDLNRLEAWTMPGNGASDRVLEKVGFQFEGVRRQNAWFKGAFHDFRSFARLRSDALGG